MPLDATAAAAASNAYATAAEGDAYHVNHLYASAWTGASTASKEAALIWATRLLDEQVDWQGSASTLTQALRWPRFGVYNYDVVFFDSTTIPTWLKHATAELARWLLTEDRTAERIIGIKAVKADVVAVDFDKYDVKPILPPPVRSLVERYGRVRGVSAGTVSLERA